MKHSIVGLAAFLTAFVAVTFGLLSVTAGDAKKPLEGDWEVVSMRKGSDNAPDDVVKNTILRISADTISVLQRKGDELTEKHKLGYKVVGDKAMDLTKPDQKDVKQGLYELKDGQLKLAIFEGGVPDGNGNFKELTGRPKSFDDTPGQLNIVLKRKK